MIQIMHRNRMSILASMLELARDGVRKTRIMYGANLSYDQLNIFLDLLKQNKMIDEVSVTETGGRSTTEYRSTPKGLDFLKKYEEIHAMLSDEDSEERIEEKESAAELEAPRIGG